MKSIVINKVLVCLLALSLALPGTALAVGGGKKYYKEGLKYEQQQQWDLAAQQFTLAVNAEPGNAEFRMHYVAAIQKAALMYIKRGDDLYDQKDIQGAYMAYKMAYGYDQGNDMARLKMERMVDLQKAQAAGTDAPQINRTGNVINTSNEIQVKSRPKGKESLLNVQFRETPARLVFTGLARNLGLNVVFDESVIKGEQKITVDLRDITEARAFDIILKTYKYSFEQLDRRTILIYADGPAGPMGRQKFEQFLVKAFYLNNVSAAQVQKVIQPMLGTGGRQVVTMDGPNSPSNTLIVKATAAELEMVQELLTSLDKNKSEVVVDVEIYEVSKNNLLQIGNQVPTSTTANTPGSSLSNLGGIASRLAGGAPGIVPSGGILALPLTALSFLQSKGDSKLIAKTQIHVLDGQKNVTKVGSRVPVRTGTSYPGGYNNNNNNNNNNQNNPLNGLFNNNGTIDNIAYEDVGLVIDVKPVITSEGYVEMDMKFESKGIASGGPSANPLNPTFTQRTLNTTSRLRDGVTGIVAQINQQNNDNSRGGLPILSMIPFIGRLTATPKQTNSNTDIIITVTPHIIRSQGITKDDFLARKAGGMNVGPSPEIESVVNRAQQEEEEERRIIAQQMPQAEPMPLNPPSGIQTAPQIQTASNSFNNNTAPAPIAPAFTNQTATTNQATTSNPAPIRNVNNVIQGSPASRPISPVSNESTGNVPPPANSFVPKTDNKESDESIDEKGSSENKDISKAMRLNITPRPGTIETGKSFIIGVELTGDAQFNGAILSMKYDRTAIRFKQIRDGGMFGVNQASTEEANGNLIVRLAQQSASLKGNGRLVMLEFATVNEGQSEIGFNNGASVVYMPGNATASANGSPIKVTVGRSTTAFNQ